jgi:MOSC domain-containing protein YiiM
LKKGENPLNGRIVSVNIGTPKVVTWRGQTFSTAIEKTPVNAPVPVRGVNVGDDDQADRTVHGGRNKAVYAYAVADYSWWQSREGIDPVPGLFGENLTTEGVDLGSCLIGERWKAGSAVLEVSEPRLPCYKLGFRLRDAAFLSRFAKALRPGAYFRIVGEGWVGPGDTLTLLHRPEDHEVSIREVMRIRLFAHEERAKLATVPALSAGYRDWAMLKPKEFDGSLGADDR